MLRSAWSACRSNSTQQLRLWREEEGCPRRQAGTWAMPLSAPQGRHADGCPSSLPVLPLVSFCWIILIIQNTVILKSAISDSHIPPPANTLFLSFLKGGYLCPLLLVLFLKCALVSLVASPLNKIILVKLTHGLCVTKSSGHSSVLLSRSLAAGCGPASLLKALFPL